MKYKIIGWLDMVLGGLGFILQTVNLLVVYPKMKVLYGELGKNTPSSTQMYPFTTSITILALAVVVWLGWRLAFGKNPNDKLFKWGMLALAAVLLGMGYIMAYSTMSLVEPIYNISNGL